MKKNIFAAALSGIFLILIFPKAQMGLLAWAALVPLLFVLREQQPKAAFKLGLLTGLVYFGGGLYWIPYTLSIYGKLPEFLSWLILMLMVSVLSLYVGLFSFGITLCSSSFNVFYPLLAGAWWVTVELMRTYLLSGFPWVLLGYSQINFLPVIQVSDITGVYGISFLIVFINAIIADFLYKFSNKVETKKLPWGWAAAGILLISLCVIYGDWRLDQPVAEGSLKLALIQGNIPQDQKWDGAYKDQVFQVYNDMSLQAVRDNKPDLIVWPEAATPFYFEREEPYHERTLLLARACGSYMVFGSPGFEVYDNQAYPFNGAYLISPQGEKIGCYKKIHLVPFGEYVPMQKLFSFAGKLVAQAGNFVSGEDHNLLCLDRARIGTVICYEVIFPDLVRRFVKDGANVLITITNDAWFGETAAPYQHFSMARMRAVENRRFIARAANTGISGFIDPCGRVLKQGGVFTREYLDMAIAPLDKITFYAAYGDVFAYACVLFVVSSLIICYKFKQ